MIFHLYTISKMHSSKNTFMENSIYKFIRYNVTPPLFVCCFTMVTQALVVIGNPLLAFDDRFLFRFYEGLFSPFAWKVILVFYTWAYLSLIIPGKIFRGPPTPKAGYQPEYKSNGFQYYVISMMAYGTIIYRHPGISVQIFDEFSSIIAVLNFTALVICFQLLISGLLTPNKDSDDNHSYLYLFYRGVHVHPRLLGVDVKQWTNCRVGMLSWALLTINFSIASLIINGSVEKALGSVVHAVLTNIYLAKFFYWETGYFNTLDMKMDRAGYYLCWGCLCFVQAFLAFTSYFMVNHPSDLSVGQLMSIFIFGSISIMLNYNVDYQKELFVTTKGDCTIWGKQAESLAVEYRDHTGRVVESKLLISGFWGVSRHMNYVFEILFAISLCLPGLFHGIWPFLYFIFIVSLLIHRTYRDDEKCSAKYKKYWVEYCRIVPYKLIPGVF